MGTINTFTCPIGTMEWCTMHLLGYGYEMTGRFKNCSKMISKVVPRPSGELTYVVLGCFKLLLIHISQYKFPKSLEKGPIWDLKRVKTESKTHFSKSNPRPLGILK